MSFKIIGSIQIEIIFIMMIIKQIIENFKRLGKKDNLKVIYPK